MCGQPCCIAAPDAHGPRSFPEFHRAVSSVLSGGSLMWWCHLLPPYSCSYPKPPRHQTSAPDPNTHARTHHHPPRTHPHKHIQTGHSVCCVVNRGFGELFSSLVSAERQADLSAE